MGKETATEPQPADGRPARRAVLCELVGVLVAALVVWAAYLNLDGHYPPWLTVTATVGVTVCVMQASRLFIIRALLRRMGRKSHKGWSSLAFAFVAVLPLVLPYRPFTGTEKRVCMRAVTAAIVAERDIDDESAAPLLDILASESRIRYGIRHRIEQVADAVRDQLGTDRGDPVTRVAAAGKRLQLNCGYGRPPF